MNDTYILKRPKLTELLIEMDKFTQSMEGFIEKHPTYEFTMTDIQKESDGFSVKINVIKHEKQEYN